MIAGKGNKIAILSKMKINPYINRLIKIIGRETVKRRINAYLVGGPVRDLLLGKSNIDLDIVLDKDVKRVIVPLARILSASYVYHPRFKTAKLFLKDFHIDMATIREEYYPCIGSLPQVRITSTINKDLFRRDFTINAMAMKISERGITDLIDPYNGREDLKRKKIRVIHENSFLDDPTRIIRAIRFATRFNFSFERNTLQLLKEAVAKNVFSKITAVRIGNEIIRILKEDNPFKGIKKVWQLCGLEFIHPAIKFDVRWEKYSSQISRWARRFEENICQPLERWLIYFIFLTERLDKNSLEHLCMKYELDKHKRLVVLHASKIRGVNEHRFFGCKNSELFNLLNPIFPESIIYLIVKIKDISLKRKIFNFLIKFYQTKLFTDGEKLKKMGFSPGPAFNKILEALFFARLDGIVHSEKEEENFITENFSSEL
ncbi:MAG: CCA tRNA nucleotidyltransferase [Candidatus Omnitrophota bacterium]